MRLYSWVKKYKSTLNGVLITAFSSLLINSISGIRDSIVLTPKLVLMAILDFSSLHGFLTWLSFSLIIYFNAFSLILDLVTKRKSYSEDFSKIMKEHTSSRISSTLGKGCLSWGEGKTLIVANEIIFGWEAANVVVYEYNDKKYSFLPHDESRRRYGSEDSSDIKSYYFSKEEWECEGNKRRKEGTPRFMLSQAMINFNKNKRSLILNLRRTDWNQTSFVWKKFLQSPDELMIQYSKGISNGTGAEPYLPSSLCLHLVVETSDGKIVLSHISNKKSKDYPGTYAVTLGEQLELEDFYEKGEIKDSFCINWLRRAFREEYNMTKEEYALMINEESFRVLSVDFEADRYNFALCSIVKSKCSFDDFKAYFESKLDKNEADGLYPLSYEEIPSILLSYKQKGKNDELSREKMECQFHPSSYLRLFLVFLHKYGYADGERKIIEESKREGKKEK